MMLRPSRLLAASLAALTMALPAMAGAGVVSSTFEARFTVVATCSVSTASASRVAVDCASASTPWLLDGAAPAPQQVAGPDAQRVTVYF